MLSVNTIKRLKSLQLKKYRDEYGEFIVEGPKPVSELLKSTFEVTGVFATVNWMEKNAQLLKDQSFKVYQVSNTELQRISGLVTPNEVVAAVRIPKNEPARDNFKGLVLMLDHISDPGNLGTIIRIADWFGVTSIVCSENSVELYNPKVIQASMGSFLRIPVFYGDLAEVIKQFCTGVPVYGTYLAGTNLYAQPLPEHAIIVMGNESHGVDINLAPLIGQKLFIPSFSSGAESLNVSTAAAVVCSEFRRNVLQDRLTHKND